MTIQTDQRPRAGYRVLAPEALRALRPLGDSPQQLPLDSGLSLLVQLRVSQVNGCAFCCALHADQARRARESQHRLDVLAA